MILYYSKIASCSDAILVIHTTVGGVSVSNRAHMGLRNL